MVQNVSFFGNKSDNKPVGVQVFALQHLVEPIIKTTTTTCESWKEEEEEEEGRGVGHVSRSVSPRLSTSGSAILTNDASEMLARVTCVE